jgi:hypothetical protein
VNTEVETGQVRIDVRGVQIDSLHFARPPSQRESPWKIGVGQWVTNYTKGKERTLHQRKMHLFLDLVVEQTDEVHYLLEKTEVGG